MAGPNSVNMRLFAVAIVILTINNGIINAQTEPPPYTFGFIPSSINEISIAFPLHSKWHLSGQLDAQFVTQGTYEIKNPFAYGQRFAIRPWLVYDGFEKLKLWLGYNHNQKYEIVPTGNYKTLEQRITVMATISQTLPKGSMFEQLRFETKFFDDKNGDHQTVPRIRGRFGVNHFLRQDRPHPWFQSANISYYAELMLKFASESYAPNNFDIFKQSVYYSAGLTKNFHFLLGLFAQMQLRTNGKQFDIYYGPVFTFKWNIVPKERETFEHADGGSD